MTVLVRCLASKASPSTAIIFLKRAVYAWWVRVGLGLGLACTPGEGDWGGGVEEEGARVTVRVGIRVRGRFWGERWGEGLGQDRGEGRRWGSGSGQGEDQAAEGSAR